MLATQQLPLVRLLARLLEALELVAALLSDEAELLQELSLAGAGGMGEQRAQRNAVVVDGMVNALPHVHSILAGAAAATRNGDYEESQTAVAAVNDVCRSWALFGITFCRVSGRLLLPSPDCQAAAAGAAEMLLRLAPLLPGLPLRARQSSSGGIEYVAASSADAIVAEWEHPEAVLTSNPPQCLAVVSAGLASRLLRTEPLGYEPPGSSRKHQPAATCGSSGIGSNSGSDIANGSYRRGLAAMAWSAAMSAFKFQWALARQAAELPQGGTAQVIFPLRNGAFAAGGFSRIAHEACDAALAALLGGLVGAFDLQQKL